MAEVLASLKKIGGNGEEYTETVLWTNPSPTASFAGQNVTLSDSITNYKYMKITWKTTPSDTAYSSAYVLVSDLASMTATNGSRFMSISCMSTNVYKRNVTYNSATSIGISTSYRENASGSNNGVCIPLEILGVNELEHQTVVGNYDILPFTNLAANATYTTSTKGLVKAAYLTVNLPSQSGRTIVLTNVSPITGAIDNTHIYRVDTNSIGNYDDNVVFDFSVTNGTFSLTGAIAGSATICSLAYTY